MADNAKSEANFRINIDGNAAGATKDVAANARLAAKAIGAYEDEIKVLSGDLRRLRGNSDEVNATKKKLKDRIDSARAAVSKLTVELNKQGTSYASASAAAKKYGAGLGARLTVATKGAASAVGGAITKAAKPLGKKLGTALAPTAKKLADALKPAAQKIGTVLAPAGRQVARFGAGAGRALRVVGTGAKQVAGSALPSLSSALSVAAAGAVTASVAIAAAAVAAGAAAVGFIGLGIAAAASAQKMQRQRQALLGNAEDAERLGGQITALAGKVPQGVDELHALSVELSKTRLPGKALVDTMNAVAQATGAVDASAGATIQEIVTRGQHSGRLFLGQRELQGTGIDFDDVAREYAAGTRKSIAAARKELLVGAVPLEQGAEAIRKATEKMFGDLNLKNAFSLENAPKKFFEQFKSLTAGINFGPLEKGLQAAFGQLSPEAPLGRAVKTFFEGVGSDLVDVAARGIPVLLEGFKWLIVGALRVGTFFYEMKKKVKDAFNSDDWVGLGKAIVLGLCEGINGSWKFVFDAVKGLGQSIKTAFTGEMEIHSPSKVFARYGTNTVDGYAQGVEAGSRRAQSAVVNMVAAPEAAKASGTATASGGTVGEIHLHFHGGGHDASSMQSPAFLAAITRAVRDAANAEGIAA